MKQVLILLLISFTFGCEKETNTPIEPQKTEQRTYISVSDFESLEISNRNGYYPFHSPFTLIDNDIFNPANFFINNLKKVDSVEYNRINTDRNIYLGVNFNPFTVKYFYNNGTDTTVTRLVPAYIQNKETRIPNLAYNQLHTNNGQFWVKITKTPRYESVYSPYCGINRLRWTYNVISSSGTNVNVIIDSNCSNQLNYQMIF